VAASGVRGDVCWGEAIEIDLDVKECLAFRNGCAETVDAGGSVGMVRSVIRWMSQVGGAAGVTVTV